MFLSMEQKLLRMSDQASRLDRCCFGLVTIVTAQIRQLVELSGEERRLLGQPKRAFNTCNLLFFTGRTLSAWAGGAGC